jgi:hypothetical protein
MKGNTMPTGRNLFTNKTITASAASQSVTVPVGDVDFISVGVQVSAVSGAGAQAVFQVQWSFDGDVWTDAGAEPEDIIATLTAPGNRVKRIPVKATYWRLGAQITGTTPSFTVTANTLVW